MKYKLIILGVVVVVIAGAILILDVEVKPLGSVTPGGEYNYVTSTADNGAAFAYTAQTTVVIATTTPAGFTIRGDENLTAPTLGSVIISSSSVGDLIIHNATSTTDDSSTTVAFFNADALAGAVPEGTYVFDIVMSRGIVLDFSAGFNGVFTITWRR